MICPECGCELIEGLRVSHDVSLMFGERDISRVELLDADCHNCKSEWLIVMLFSSTGSQISNSAIDVTSL